MGASEVDTLLIHPTEGTTGPPLLLDTEIPTNWLWYLRLALINLVGWLVALALLLQIANYMQDATSLFLEQ
jgi:hypothetical protein